MTGNGVASGLAWVGSTIPDLVELPFGPLVKHRSWSHWPYPYALITFSIWYWGARNGDLLFSYLSFIGVGALLHLVEDSLSPGGIPLKAPMGVRKGLGIYKTFHLSEYMVALLISAIALLISFYQGCLDVTYLVGEIERVSNVSQLIIYRVTGKL